MRGEEKATGDYGNLDYFLRIWEVAFEWYQEYFIQDDCIVIIIKAQLRVKEMFCYFLKWP